MLDVLCSTRLDVGALLVSGALEEVVPERLPLRLIDVVDPVLAGALVLLEPLALLPGFFKDPGALAPFEDPGALAPFEDPGDLAPFEDPGALEPFWDPGALEPFWDPGALVLNVIIPGALVLLVRRLFSPLVFPMYFVKSKMSNTAFASFTVSIDSLAFPPSFIALSPISVASLAFCLPWYDAIVRRC